MQAQPVADEGGGHEHRGLFNLGRPHRVVPVGPAVLDWTGHASEESAEGYVHGHDDYDPGEALMAASELREPPPPEPVEAPAPQAQHHAADHAFAPAPVAAPQPEPLAHDPFAAALGDPRQH
jgi:hypothetical protein